MLLYNDTKAPNPRRVRIFLAEKGLEVDRVDVDILAGEHKQPEFTAVNPLQRLPVLVLDDGTKIAETMAICRYIESLEPAPVLMGIDELDRAIVEMWQRHIEFHIFWCASQVMRHLIPALSVIEDPQVPEWGNANITRLEDGYRWLDHELGQRLYCAGTRFSVADITALCAVDFAKFAKIGIAPELTSLSAWYERVSGRPSAGA